MRNSVLRLTISGQGQKHASPQRGMRGEKKRTGVGLHGIRHQATGIRNAPGVLKTSKKIEASNRFIIKKLLTIRKTPAERRWWAIQDSNL